MADERLRQIEREAALGNPRAQVFLFKEELRTGSDLVDLLQKEHRVDFLSLLVQQKVVTYEQIEQAICPSLGLNQQHSSRLDNLRRFQILENNEKGNEGITAIDGNHYPPPTLEQIRAYLSIEMLRLISQIDQPTLLLVPFSMSLKSFEERVTSQRGELVEQQRANVFWDLDYDRTGGLKYFPERFGNDPGGIEKSEILRSHDERNNFPGWQVIIVDGRENTDRESLIYSVGESDEVEFKDANNYLAEYREKGLSGLTPEDWLSLHLLAMESGNPFDSTVWCWNFASYLGSGISVPISKWSEDDNQVVLRWYACGAPHNKPISRPAVRV